MTGVSIPCSFVNVHHRIPIEADAFWYLAHTGESAGYDGFDRRNDVVFVGQGEPFEWLRVGHGNVRAVDVLDGRVKIIEGVFVDERGETLACAVVFPALFGNDDAVGLFDRINQQVDVDRANAAQVDDFGLDALFGEVFGGLHGDMYQARERNERDMTALAPHFAAIQGNGVFNAFVRHLASHVVEQFVFNEDDRIGIAYSGFEHAFGVVGRGRHDDFEARD